MKSIFLSCLVLLFHPSFAQDTLTLQSGKVEVVDVIAVDKANGLIIYVQNSDTVYLSSNAVQKQIINGNFEANLPNSISNMSVKNNSGFTSKAGFFREVGKYNYGPLAIRTNLASLLINQTPYSNPYFSRNKILSLEPEYRFTDNFALKLPLLLGITRSSSQEDEWSYKGQGWYDYNQNPDIAPKILYFNDYYYGSYDDRPRDLIFQAGIYPTLYPFGQVKNSFYLAIGLNLGLGDFKSAEYYHKHSWNTFWEEGFWEITDETGFSSAMPNNGKKDDLVFQKVDDGEYNLIYSEKYTNSVRSSHFINRVYLVYRFGGENISASKHLQ